jgi:hypothetical protein
MGLLDVDVRENGGYADILCLPPDPHQIERFRITRMMGCLAENGPLESLWNVLSRERQHALTDLSDDQSARTSGGRPVDRVLSGRGTFSTHPVFHVP